jgi:NhaA family Na+:H+ antiporter
MLDPPDHGPNARKTRARSFAERPRAALKRFLEIEASSGIVLLAAAVLALFLANSGLAEAYVEFWQTQLGLGFGALRFERSLAWFVNDVLMAAFFFVVGLEIRRDLYDGELSDAKRAALPALAALGGMIAPAVLYLTVAHAEPTRKGWGVPTATDIAFAVGILSLLGRRVPSALRSLLLALAVIDDLGAIVVIAVFYSSGLNLGGLLLFAAGIAVIPVLQRLGLRRKVIYAAPALLAWIGAYLSGVHPTIAGVAVGFVTPVRTRPGDQRSPAAELVEMLHPWVAYLIMPIFALANSGVRIGSVSLAGAQGKVVMGVMIGLVAGKPLGVLLSCWLSLRVGVARLPAGLSTRHLVVLGTIAGVGFTMALFVAELAFADAKLLAAAKLGVLSGSVLAAVVGLVCGRSLLTRSRAREN